MNKDLFNELKFLANRTIRLDNSTQAVKINNEEIGKIQNNNIDATQIKHGIDLLKTKINEIIRTQQKEVKERKRKPRFGFLDYMKVPTKMKTIYVREAEHERLKRK